MSYMLPGVGDCTVIFIRGEGLVYGGTRKFLNVEAACQLLCPLLYRKRRESTFNKILQGIPANWRLWDDIVVPFGDYRGVAISLIIIDLDMDTFSYSDGYFNNVQEFIPRDYRLPLVYFRTSTSIPTTDSNLVAFQHIGPPSLKAGDFSHPRFYPNNATTTPQITALVGRVLSDFGHIWRHILRQPYCNSTFLKFASATLQIAKLDFEIDQDATRWFPHLKTRGPFVGVLDLPLWNSVLLCPDLPRVFSWGKVNVVCDQDLSNALSMAQEDARSRISSKSKIGHKMTYLLLSVRQIALCQQNDQEEFIYSAPEVLLNGVDDPSALGVQLLLHAALLAFPTTSIPPLCKLPTEIQDRILWFFSKGELDAARLGCILGIGSTFQWLRNDSTRRRGPIERLENSTMRAYITPVENRILFGGVFSGLCYR